MIYFILTLNFKYLNFNEHQIFYTQNICLNLIIYPGYMFLLQLIKNDFFIRETEP